MRQFKYVANCCWWPGKSDLLIVGNGGVKDTKTYEESEELSGYVMDLQKFEKLLKQAMSEGTISIERSVITGIEEAVFKV